MQRLQIRNPEYIKWENDVTEHIEDLLEATRSDAQGIVEGQARAMTLAWARKLDARSAADRVIKAATPAQEAGQAR